MVSKTSVLFVVAMLCVCSTLVAMPMANQNNYSDADVIEISLKKDPTEYHCKYSDKFFMDSATEYNPSLATASLVLGMASLAHIADARVHHTDNAKQMLTDAGFKDFEVNADYLQEPRAETNGTFIAQKVIRATDGHTFTVLAIGFRWGDYGREWVNNVDVGYGDEYGNHEGFKKSALRSIDFINDYIERNNITGHIKIWGSGYSRPSAIMNVLAGLVDTAIAENRTLFGNYTHIGLDDVYAYTFESANTVAPPSTLDVHGPAYCNIWNHVGSADLVGMIPSAKWGFTMYGHVLNYPDVSVKFDIDTPEWKNMLRFYEELGKESGRDRNSLRIYAYALEWDGEFIPTAKLKDISDQRQNETLRDVVSKAVNAAMDNLASNREEFVNNVQPKLEEFMFKVMRFGLDNFAVFFFDFLLRLASDQAGSLQAGLAIMMESETMFKYAIDKHILAAIEDSGLDPKDADAIESLFFKASLDTTNVLVKEFKNDPTMEIFVTFVGNSPQIIMQHADYHYYYSWLLSNDPYYN